MAAAGEKDWQKLETLFGGSEKVHSLVCLPCHRDDINMPAAGYCNDCQEHLCLHCYKSHKKARPCRHHTLLDEDNMPSTQQLAESPVHGDNSDNLTTPCPYHQNEMIKFFCNDHGLLLCSICVAYKHTKNCQVDYLPDGVIIDSRYYKETMTRVDHLLEKCTKLKAKTNKDVVQSNDSLKSALLDVQKYRQEINDRIDELEKEIEKKIKALQHQNDERQQTVDTTCDDVIQMLQQMNDKVKQIDTSEQADKLFVAVVQIRNQLNDFEEIIFSLSAAGKTGEYKFTPTEAINDVLQCETMIGDVSMELQGETCTKTSQPASLASAEGYTIPTLLDEICVQTSEDTDRCNITGMTALPPNRLVLADNRNNSIKLVDLNTRSVTSQLSLGKEQDDSPVDITSTTNKQVAVTVPGRKLIQFLSISNKLKKTNKIQTEDKCYGICCYQKKLIVTSAYRNELDILDMKGRVQTRVQLPSAGEDICHEPDNVQANSRCIYVSDNHHVVMLNWKGEITGTFEDMVNPSSISLLRDGSVIVCDGITGSLCQMSEDGTNRGTVLRDVRSLNALCVNTGRNELYISRYTEKRDRIDDNILLYKI